jgi:hypothetical protein
MSALANGIEIRMYTLIETTAVVQCAVAAHS